MTKRRDSDSISSSASESGESESSSPEAPDIPTGNRRNSNAGTKPKQWTIKTLATHFQTLEQTIKELINNSNNNNGGSSSSSSSSNVPDQSVLDAINQKLEAIKENTDLLPDISTSMEHISSDMHQLNTTSIRSFENLFTITVENIPASVVFGFLRDVTYKKNDSSLTVITDLGKLFSPWLKRHHPEYHASAPHIFENTTFRAWGKLLLEMCEALHTHNQLDEFRKQYRGTSNRIWGMELKAGIAEEYKAGKPIGQPRKRKAAEVEGEESVEEAPGGSGNDEEQIDEEEARRLEEKRQGKLPEYKAVASSSKNPPELPKAKNPKKNDRKKSTMKGGKK